MGNAAGFSVRAEMLVEVCIWAPAVSDDYRYYMLWFCVDTILILVVWWPLINKKI